MGPATVWPRLRPRVAPFGYLRVRNDTARLGTLRVQPIEFGLLHLRQTVEPSSVPDHPFDYHRGDNGVGIQARLVVAGTPAHTIITIGRFYVVFLYFARRIILHSILTEVTAV